MAATQPAGSHLAEALAQALQRPADASQTSASPRARGHYMLDALLDGRSMSSVLERMRFRARRGASARSAEALGEACSGRLVKVARLRELLGESTICMREHNSC